MKPNPIFTIILMLLSTASIASAATPTEPTTSIPIMHHETDWQADDNNATPVSSSSTNSTASQASAITAPKQISNAAPNPNIAPTAAPTNKAANNNANIKNSDSGDEFIKAIMKRNEILSQLQYEKQVLVLRQDILQLKVNIDKLEAENAPPQSKNSLNFRGGVSDNSGVNFTGKPQLVEIFIKNDKPQATLYYHGSVITVNIGSKLGTYTVKNISKNTVTLADNKNKSTILNILQSTSP